MNHHAQQAAALVCYSKDTQPYTLCYTVLTTLLKGYQGLQGKIGNSHHLKERVDMKSSVVASCDGKALEGGPGRVSQQGQKLLPCPSLLQHSCKEVWRPAVSQNR